LITSRCCILADTITARSE